MKRKIAILLSAMMVTTAMPLSANAAYLNPNDTLSAGFAKANNPIDKRVNQGSDSDYLKPNVTTDTLKERQSMLHFEFKEDKTGDIKAGDTFTIELENGTFDEKYLETYQYVNSTSDVQGKAQIVKYDEIKNLNTLTDVYQYIVNKGVKANPVYAGKVDTDGGQTTVTAGSVTQFSKADETTPVLKQVADTVEFIKAKGDTAQAPGGIINTTTGDQAGFVDAVNKVNNLTGDAAYADWKALTKALAEEMAGEIQTNKVNLPTIPYELKIITPTTAEVKMLVGLSNDDLGIENVKSVDVDTSKVTGFKVVTSGTTSVDNTNGLNQAGFTGGVEGIALSDTSDSAIVRGNHSKISGSYLAIPLGGVVADTDAPIKATVDARYTEKIKSGTQTITKNVSNGSTDLVYAERNVKYFEDYAFLEPIVVSENVRDTIGKTTSSSNGVKTEAKVNLRLNSGFKFKLDGTDKFDVNNVKVYNAANGQHIPFKSGTKASLSSNGSTLTFELDLSKVNRNNPIGLRIGVEYNDTTVTPNVTRFVGLPVEGINDKQFGDVEVTVSGDGINTQSKLVAKRQTLGYDLKTVKDPQEIIAGRHYTPNNYNYNSSSYSSTNNGTMVEGDNTTVEIQFSEKVPNTLVESRALDFTVPEGVKITDAYIDLNSVKNITGLDKTDFEIINNGKTLRLKRDTYKVNDSNSTTNLASFRFKLDLSVDPGFKGNIELAVTGGGQSDETKAVVAKAVAPFEIKTQTTKANLGYQDYNTANITITETKPGMFLQNKLATLSLKAPYGTKEIGFSAADFEVTGGELNIKEKDFKINNDGVISFTIDKASYKNPSSITIKNVKVGTTRSVPYGAYDLALSGDAVINNYADKLNDDKSFDIDTQGDKKYYDLVKQNNTDHYEFKNYLNIITETGTFDKTVKVSVGEKTVLIGDQAVDMDVAPYIQASSNSTMVPLRFVSVALGVDSSSVTNPDESSKIAWDANTKTTTIYYGAGTGQKIIQFQAGSNIMTVDGTRIPMEYGVKAEIKDGRMFVPFRALGQALGVTVDWDADTRTAIYNGDNGRNVNTTTTATTESTTESTTASTTTESTTASDSTTETTTAKK